MGVTMNSAIQRLQRDEAGLIGKIIAEGFSDDPVNNWAFNGTSAMQPVFTTMAKHLYLPNGFGHKTPDGKAGTMWLPPHAAKEYGSIATIKMALSIARYGGPKAISNTLRLDGFLKQKQPVAPHYYLFAISVHPNLQGTGVGGKLMRAALEDVDQAHMPAYLESSKDTNIGFYQSHGFIVIDKVKPTPDCPPLWLMWRDAQQ